MEKINNAPIKHKQHEEDPTKIPRVPEQHRKS